MTEVMYDVHDLGLMFDCTNHADDHDVCTIVSTLCNVLVEACMRFDNNFEPTIYEKGHVRIDLYMTDDTLIEIFDTVMGVIKQVEIQNPEHIKIY